MIEDQGAAIYGCLAQREADKKFIFKKDLFHLDSVKLDTVKVIFHMLFLV